MRVILIFVVCTIFLSGFLYETLSCCTCTPSAPGPANPIYLRLMRATAQKNIEKAVTLLTQANDMLTEAKARGKDTSSAEASIMEASTLLEKARASLANPIAANNYALKAIKLLKKAQELLKT